MTSKVQRYNQLIAEIAKLQNNMQQLNKQIIAKKAYRLVTDIIKMPLPDIFTG